MNIGTTFSRDQEFHKLITRRPDVDLTTAALELARDACPQLDFGTVHRWIDERAAEVTGPLLAARSDREAIAQLGRCLAERHDLRGRSDSYDFAESSYLNRVIERKSGIPISLSVLYMAVAEKAGWPLQGISAPRHFLTRYDGSHGPLFIDAFAGGAILSQDECLLRAESATGLSRDAVLPMFKPATPREIIIRMLNNLKALYARQEAWRGAWTVQARLVALQPAAYAERRDLALLSLKAARFGLAVDQLEACLRDCPKDELPVLEQQIEEARRGVATWN